MEISEEDILKNINEELSVDLEKYDSVDFDKDYDNLSDFEKIFVKREQVSRNESKIFNDVVHFNYAMVHMLNPYKYNFQIREIYDII